MKRAGGAVAAFRKIEDNGEIESIYRSAKAAVEDLRHLDARNPDITLGDLPENHGEEAIVCPMLNVRAINDIYFWTRELRKRIPGCTISGDPSGSSGGLDMKLVIPLHVREATTFGNPPLVVPPPGKPSNDRLWLLLFALIVLLVAMWRM